LSLARIVPSHGYKDNPLHPLFFKGEFLSASRILPPVTEALRESFTCSCKREDCSGTPIRPACHGPSLTRRTRRPLPYPDDITGEGIRSVPSITNGQFPLGRGRGPSGQGGCPGRGVSPCQSQDIPPGTEAVPTSFQGGILPRKTATAVQERGTATVPKNCLTVSSVYIHHPSKSLAWLTQIQYDVKLLNFIRKATPLRASCIAAGAHAVGETHANLGDSGSPLVRQPVIYLSEGSGEYA
jgi:hypothetical protein